MKDFKKFLEEASIKGNIGIPGEPRKKDGESSYISDVDTRVTRRMGIRKDDVSQMRIIGPRLGQLIQQSMPYQTGHERELEELATKVISHTYDSIIKRYEIELDIKFTKDVKKFMDDSEEKNENPPPKFKEVVEDDLKNEVHKRKIANLIIQGEAKNTKHILHTDEVKEGLKEIYGEDGYEEIFNLWDELTKTADKLDWIMPVDDRSRMMEQMPEGLAGACSVDWKEKEEKTEDEDDAQEEQEKTWKGDEDEESMYSEDDEPMENFNKTPVVRARGIDFPMLLHEAVKGIYEVLSLAGIPEDERAAKVALSNTGISDEAEDWRYGPEMASDLRDFINQNPNIDKYPNIRDEVYKKMIDKKTMPTADFLSLFRGILSKTDIARKSIDKIIDEVISELDIFHKYKEDMERYHQEMEEYDRKLAKYNKDMEEYEKKKKEYDDHIKNNPDSKEGEREDETTRLINKTIEKEKDYSTWSKRDIQSEIDKALDDGDYNRVGELSKFLENNEIREMYLREIELVRENKNIHLKRNI
jgi:hypothetical protein